MKEYVIAYTYKGQRRYERIRARTPEEAKDIFKRTHAEPIVNCLREIRAGIDRAGLKMH